MCDYLSRLTILKTEIVSHSISKSKTKTNFIYYILLVLTTGFSWKFSIDAFHSKLHPASVMKLPYRITSDISWSRFGDLSSSGSGRSSQTRTVRPIVNLIIQLYFKLPRIWQVIPNMTDKTYSWEVSPRSSAVLCHRSHHHSNNHQRLHYHHHHHYRHHYLKGLCHSDLSHFTSLKCVFTLIAMKFVQWRLNNCIDTVCCCPLLRIARMEMDCILKNLASIF